MKSKVSRSADDARFTFSVSITWFVSRSQISTVSMSLAVSTCPCDVTERMAVLSSTVPPADTYSGDFSQTIDSIVALPPVPVPTGNCCSSPTPSPLALTSCIFTTPGVSVFRLMPVGMASYAPPVLSASVPPSSGVSFVSTLDPPPPKSFHRPTSPKSFTVVPWNCFDSMVFSPVE